MRAESHHKPHATLGNFLWCKALACSPSVKVGLVGLHCTKNSEVIQNSRDAYIYIRAFPNQMAKQQTSVLKKAKELC